MQFCRWKILEYSNSNIFEKSDFPDYIEEDGFFDYADSSIEIWMEIIRVGQSGLAIKYTDLQIRVGHSNDIIRIHE